MFTITLLLKTKLKNYLVSTNTQIHKISRYVAIFYHMQMFCFSLLTNFEIASFLVILLNPFVPNKPFLYPLKTSENLKVLWCFQGVKKGCIGNKWLKRCWPCALETKIMKPALYEVLENKKNKKNRLLNHTAIFFPGSFPNFSKQLFCKMPTES